MNDRFLKACLRQTVDRTPVWFMRQAGRYMAEYQAIRRRHSILEVCKTPALAAEVTLQPIQRFQLDAAIIFADILLPLEAMGLNLEFIEGKGPVIDNPIRGEVGIVELRAVDGGEQCSPGCAGPRRRGAVEGSERGARASRTHARPARARTP